MKFAYRVTLSDEQEDALVGLCQELRSRLFHEGKLTSAENKRVVAYFEKNLHTLSLPFMALVSDKEKVSAGLVDAYRVFLSCTTLYSGNFPENLPLAQPALGVYNDMFAKVAEIHLNQIRTDGAFYDKEFKKLPMALRGIAHIDLQRTDNHDD